MSHTLTGSLAEIIGTEAPLVLHAEIRANQAVVPDPATDTTWLGRTPIELAEDGSFSVELPAGDALTMWQVVASWFHLAPGSRSAKQSHGWTSGWFAVTADADLADVVEVPAAPVSVDTLAGFADDLAMVADARAAYEAVLAGVGGRAPVGHDPTGAADSAPPLQALLTHLATHGGVGVIPPGTYRCDTALTVPAGAAPFSLSGAGMHATTITRTGDYGTVLAITGRSGLRVSDLTIDGGLTTHPTGANHGLTLLDCSHTRVQRVRVVNYLNSGILAYASAPGTHSHVVVEDCLVVGNGATTNNGILLSYLDRSYIRRSVAQDILGTPGIGIQLKNTCVHSGLIDVLAINCGDGIQLGGDTPGAGPRRAICSTVVAVGCLNGLICGDSYDSVVSGVLVDAQSNPATLHGIRLNAAADGITITGAQVLDVPAGAVPVRIDALNCTVELDRVVDLATSGDLVVFAATATGNVVRAKRLRRNGAEITDPHDVVNYGTTLSNAFGFEGGAETSRHTIAGDAITIRNRLTRSVLLSNEAGAASDTLATITGGVEGQQITVSTRQNTQDTTVTTTGNIALDGSASMVLDNAADTLTLVYRSAISKWCEVSRANSGA